MNKLEREWQQAVDAELARQSLLERTTSTRQYILFAVLVILLALLHGCASMNDWCEENPRACKAAVIGGGIVAACAVGAIAVSASHSGPATIHQAPAAPVNPPAPCYGCAT